MADVFSSETGAAGAPSRPLPQAEATVRTHHLLRGASKRRVWESRSTYDKAGVERESAGVGERAGCISYPPNLADASMQVGQRMPAFDAGAMDKVPSSGGIQK